MSLLQLSNQLLLSRALVEKEKMLHLTRLLVMLWMDCPRVVFPSLPKCLNWKVSCIMQSKLQLQPPILEVARQHRFLSLPFFQRQLILTTPCQQETIDIFLVEEGVLVPVGTAMETLV